MGKQTDMVFVGSSANLVFYQWKSIPVVRTKAAHIKQTKATKKQAGLFGIASHTGAKLRSLLKPELPNAGDRNMMRRFETAIASWLRTNGAAGSTMQNELPYITGFDFNESSELRKRLKVNAVVSINAANELVVGLPEMIPARDINAPAHTAGVVLKIQTAVCSLQGDDYSNSVGKEFNLLYSNALIPSQQIAFPLKLNTGSFGVTMISLEYLLVKNGRSVVVKDVHWQPAGIVGAVWGGK